MVGRLPVASTAEHRLLEGRQLRALNSQTGFAAVSAAAQREPSNFPRCCCFYLLYSPFPRDGGMGWDGMHLSTCHHRASGLNSTIRDSRARDRHPLTDERASHSTHRQADDEAVLGQPTAPPRPVWLGAAMVPSPMEFCCCRKRFAWMRETTDPSQQRGIPPGATPGRGSGS